MTDDTRTLLKVVELILGFIGVSFGVAPLIQRYLLDHTATIWTDVVGVMSAPWIWLLPTIVTVVTFAGLTLIDRALKKETR